MPKFDIVRDTAKEPLVCEECGHVNLIGDKQNNRRKKRDRHFSLDDVTFTKLKLWCVPYDSINTGLAMLFRKIEVLEEKQKKKRI